MKELYFDCFSGASGDMCLGALLDAGAPWEDMEQHLSTLALPGYRLHRQQVVKNGIGATQVRVEVTERAPEHRHLSPILELIEASPLAPRVKERSQKIFRRLAAAEGRVHRISPQEVHFHEVGAVDAIIDVVGTAIGLELLEVDRITASPLPLGSGQVECAHGLIPVPAPATLELLREAGAPTAPHPSPGELLTPTGAAIITTLAEQFGSIPPFSLKAIGYGAGTKDFSHPNVLRVILGEVKESAALHYDQIAVLEAAIDDMNPEFYGHLAQLLWQQGILDLYMTPIQMKKGRPGTLVTVLCPPAGAQETAALLLRESTTLGVRIRQENRLKVPRQVLVVETPYGQVRIKWSRLSPGSSGESLHIAPEYEDCRRLARENNLPLKTVYGIAQAQAMAVLGLYIP